MLTYIKINGFKSFHNFEMEFTPLTVIAGVNASGKSNLFDALMLLSRLAEVDLKTAFGEQRGNPSELFTQYAEGWYANEMEFVVEMLVNRLVKDKWGGTASLNNTRLRYRLIITQKKNQLGFEDLFVKHESLEKIKPADDNWINNFREADELTKATNNRGGTTVPFIKTEALGNNVAIIIRQDGKQGNRATFIGSIEQTILSKVNSTDFPHIFAVKEEMLSWQLLQLNPEDLREPTQQDVGIRDTISKTGKNLAAALYRIKEQDNYSLVAISRKLNSFLPNFTQVNVYNDTAHRQYIIKLKGDEGTEFSSRVLSEGTLRILTLCILAYDEKHTGLLCFEEPENGIHPFRIKAMLNLLKHISANFENSEQSLRQVIINTHSPVLVSNLMQWKNDKNVSIWFTQLNTRITDIDEKRLKMKISKALPVQKETQFSISFSKQEQKLTIAEVTKFLETVDTEATLKNLTETQI